MTSQLPAVGTVRYQTGFCTHASLLRGKTLDELRRLLGFRGGRLNAGPILFLEQIPAPADFQLAGYATD